MKKLSYILNKICKITKLDSAANSAKIIDVCPARLFCLQLIGNPPQQHFFYSCRFVRPYFHISDRIS